MCNMFNVSSVLLPFGTNGTIWLSLCCVAFAYFYYYVKKNQSYWKDKGIKYVQPQFLSGNLRLMRDKTFHELVREIYNAFPEERYHGMYQFLTPTLMIRDPDLIKKITIKDFEHFVNHTGLVSTETDPFFSRNLVASRDERWKDLRSTLSPTFTSSKMKIMFNLMDECAVDFVNYFKNEDKEVVEMDVKDSLQRYTNDVIASAAFGIKINSLKDRNNEFFLMGKDASNFNGLRSLKIFLHAISPTLCKLLKVKIFSSRITDFFSKIIEDTITTRKEKNIIRPDMIHLLLEAQKGRQHQEEHLEIDEGFATVPESNLIKNNQKMQITNEDVSSQAFLFFFAGFETVSTVTSFAFYELALHPNIQNRLRRELQTVNGKVTYETLLKLNYLDMVVSETLRKWPAGAVSDRQVSKDYTIKAEKPGEKNLVLKKGQVCWIPVYAIHKDEKYYPNPEKFDPERFNEENKHNINPFTYMPFGAGPRSCIGSRFALLESKLILFHVLKNFEVVPIKKTSIPLVLDKYHFNMVAKDGIWLGLKKINSD